MMLTEAEARRRRRRRLMPSVGFFSHEGWRAWRAGPPWPEVVAISELVNGASPQDLLRGGLSPELVRECVLECERQGYFWAGPLALGLGPWALGAGAAGPSRLEADSGQAQAAQAGGGAQEGGQAQAAAATAGGGAQEGGQAQAAATAGGGAQEGGQAQAAATAGGGAQASLVGGGQAQASGGAAQASLAGGGQAQASAGGAEQASLAEEDEPEEEWREDDIELVEEEHRQFWHEHSDGKGKGKKRKGIERSTPEGFIAYAPGPELVRVLDELNRRLAENDFAGRASLIDSIEGDEVQGTTKKAKKADWAKECARLLCEGVAQYRSGRVRGDPVFLYRAQFDLRPGAFAAAEETTWGYSADSERIRLVKRILKKMRRNYGDENLTRLWSQINWYTGKSWQLSERAKRHASAGPKSVFGAFYRLFGQPGSLRLVPFACFPDEKAAYLAEKAAMLLPFTDSDGFPTCRSAAFDQEGNPPLFRFVLNAAAGGSKPAEIRSQPRRMLFPGKQVQKPQGARPSALAFPGVRRPGVNPGVPVVAILLKGEVDLKSSDPPIWLDPVLEEMLPPVGEREFHVFPSFSMAQVFVAGLKRRAQEPGPLAKNGRVTSLSSAKAKAILHCTGYGKTGKIPTEERRHSDGTYWTYARPWDKSVVEYLLFGEGVTRHWESLTEDFAEAAGAGAAAAAAP